MDITQVKKILEEFGLTENEAEVYIILLSKNLTASEIAQKTSIHRINVYDILERLQEKGLVSYAVKGKRKFYESTEPKKLLESIDEKREKIKSILPELIERKKSLQEPQEAIIFKDKKGIKNILEEITKSKTPVLLFASGWGFKENFPDYYDTWHERFHINKVKIKTLISSRFKGKLKVPRPLEYKYLPSEFQFPSTTAVWEDKILIMMWSAVPIAVLIRSREISESYRKFFEILWDFAKK
jgi:HTH-type transcriptional regulator, sugar sensing transcriptional regulator